MGFIVCTVEPLEGGAVRVRLVRRVAVSGRRGLFALQLPKLVGEDGGAWSLSADALLHLAEPEAGPEKKLLFEVAPHDPERIDLYEFLDATGRTGEQSSDVLFHFKIACASLKRAHAPRGLDDLTLPAWEHGAELYEQLRLSGGLSGGSWTWSKTDISATVLGAPRKV
jgi:hypothetical protein